MSVDVLARVLRKETALDHLTIWRYLAGGNVNKGNRLLLDQTRARIEAEECAAFSAQVNTPEAPHEF